MQCARPQRCVKRASKNTWAAAMLIFSGVKSQARTAASLSCFTRVPTEPSSRTHSLSASLSACQSDISITFGIVSRSLQARCTVHHPPRQHLPQYIPVFSAILLHIDEGTQKHKELEQSERKILQLPLSLNSWEKILTRAQWKQSDYCSEAKFIHLSGVTDFQQQSFCIFSCCCFC